MGVPIHSQLMPTVNCAVKLLTKNIKRCGQKTLAKGVNEIFYIGMKDGQQIAFTLDSTNDTIITGMAMGTGQKLFAYEGNNFSNDPSVGFNKSDNGITLPQQLVFSLYSNSPATKKEIQALLTRKDLVIIYNRVSGDYEVMGANTGMSVSNFVYRPNDDNKGAFVITLAAPDEDQLPKTFIHTTSNVEDTATFLGTMVAPD